MPQIVTKSTRVSLCVSFICIFMYLFDFCSFPTRRFFPLLFVCSFVPFHSYPVCMYVFASVYFCSFVHLFFLGEVTWSFSLFSFILRFWNHILICLSLRCRLWEISILLLRVKYRFVTYSRSNSAVWWRVYVWRRLRWGVIKPELGEGEREKGNINRMNIRTCSAIGRGATMGMNDFWLWHLLS